ncbi:MAG TPA: 4Fe-4S dicluster domain-containing protein [Micromonosporaceae bacterium]|jgi:Fe-S-cluster-containing dehydrogenase component|nr:4Fe-4S dicluster domain-containing protein [Micromonosporaceae bacterium]
MADSATTAQPVIARTISVRPPGTGPGPAWGKVIDQTKCIGCHACTTACKSENDVPLSVTRTFVKSVDVGVFPQARRAFQVTRCNQCAAAPCVTACPTRAMYVRPDGIVDFDKDICIGCKACMAACPYDAIFINPDDHCAEKCNFCAHRLEIGLEPACVVVCPTGAIMVGDLADPDSEVARIVNREPVAVRRPEKGTKPKLFYKGATQATLDPLAAAQPPGDTYAWAEQPRGKDIVTAPVAGANSSAAAVISYDVAHRAPWDWRVSLYTWTKSIAAGAYLVPLLLVLLGRLESDHVLWIWVAPLVSGVFLAITAGVLIADLEHPERFYLVLTRPQWRSWLTRGGVILAGFTVALGFHLLGGLTGLTGLTAAAAVFGGPLALLSAVYTAYLFAQAKARDLWQSPLLPPHLAVQATLAGSAAFLPVLTWTAESSARDAAAWLLAGAALVHLLFLAGEITLPHVTAHARLAAHAMVGGRYRSFFWAGAGLVAVSLLAPWAGAWVALPALAGLALYEHAYVQAGQSVPLA